MRVDELVDEALIGRLDLVELQAHAVAAIAPRHSSFGVDVALRSGKAEPDTNLGTVIERAGRADRDASTAQVERESRGNGVAEPVCDRNTQDDARTATTIEVVGEQMRRERRENVLHGAVFVDVARDSKRGKLAYLFGARDRAAENEDG